MLKVILGIVLLFFTQQVFSTEIRIQNVNVIIPFPPGGGADHTFRHLESYLLQKKNIKLIPLYKPGANGVIGVTELYNSKTDGNTIFIGTVGTVAEFKIKNPEKNIILVTMLRTSIFSLVTNHKTKISSLEDFEHRLRSNTRILFGIGAPTQKIYAEALLDKLGFKHNVDFVNYKGSSPLIQDLIGGHIDVAYVPLTVTKSSIDSNKLVLLATDEDRVGHFNTPSLTNRFKSWEKTDGFVFALPPHTPPNIVEYWGKILEDYLNDKEVKSEFYKDFFSPYQYSSQLAEKLTQITLTKLK